MYSSSILLLQLLVLGQTKIHVVNDYDDAPITRATVIIQDTRGGPIDSGTTDNNGNFVTHKIAPNLRQAIILVLANGYAEKAKRINWSELPPKEVEVRLQRKVEHPATKLGIPVSERLIHTSDFVLSYDSSIRGARWVAEILRPRSYKPQPPPKLFAEDMRKSRFPHAELSDYEKAPFVPGRLASFGKTTNLLSNTSPQSPEFHRYWITVDKRVVDLLIKQEAEKAYVTTGPLFMPNIEIHELIVQEKFTVSYEVFGQNRVSVPTHFYKAILGVRDTTRGSTMVKGWAFVIPNKSIDADTELHKFSVPVDFVEKWSGCDLWPNLDDSIELRLESTTKNDWVLLP